MTETEPGRPVTRLADGAEVPAPGQWQIDPGHTELAFIGRHFMLTKVRGRFTGLTGVIEVAEAPGDSTAEVTIDMASVESGNEARDEHLRSAEPGSARAWVAAGALSDALDVVASLSSWPELPRVTRWLVAVSAGGAALAGAAGALTLGSWPGSAPIAADARDQQRRGPGRAGGDPGTAAVSPR